MQRLITKVPNLDEILGGGLPAQAIHLLVGPPGSGKTTLAQQIAFAVGTPEAPALYVTAVSEPQAKMIRHAQTFRFFDLRRVGNAVRFADVGPVLLAEGPEQGLTRIVDLVHEHTPQLLVVDSFEAFRDLTPRLEEFRRALYSFVGALSALDCTVLLLGSYATPARREAPEFTVVDGIIELDVRLERGALVRQIRVTKLRGSGFVHGNHGLEISDAGIHVFPRFLTPPDPPTYEVPRDRCTFGVPGLDEMLQGGILRGTTALVAGEPGAGKTMLALHFLLNGVLQGEPGVFVSFQEDPNQLTRLAEDFGWDIAAMEEAGQLIVLYDSPVELNPDAHVPRVAEAVERIGAQRVVVDSISDLRAGHVDDVRFAQYTYALVQYFKNNRITGLLTNEFSEVFGRIVLSGVGISHIADAVILLRYVEVGAEIRRAITVLKARGMDHSMEVREFRISRKGLEVGERFQDAVSPLTGRPLS